LKSDNLGPAEAKRKPVFDTDGRNLGYFAGSIVAFWADYWQADRRNPQTVVQAPDL